MRGGWSATDAEVASVEGSVDAAPLLDRLELLFDETVNVLVFGAAIVAGTVRVCGFSSRRGFRGRVDHAH
jgi:hypothetical protein